MPKSSAPARELQPIQMLERGLGKISSLENQGSLKNQECTPRDAQIMFWASKLSKKSDLTTQRSPTVVLLKNGGTPKASFEQIRVFRRT